MAQNVETLNGIHFRQMTKNDIKEVINIWKSFGYNEVEYLLEIVLQIDKNAYFVAIDSNNEKVIGLCGGPFIRPDLAVVSLYGIRKEYFGRGIGKRLFNCVMNYIGNRNCYLFSMADKISLYRDRLGFTSDSNINAVFYSAKVNKNIKPIFEKNDIKLESIESETIINKVIEYDKRVIHCRREEFIRLLFKDKDSLSYVALNPTTDEVIGYGSIRKNSGNVGVLSPVYADNYLVAKQLTEKLINSFEFSIKSHYIYIAIDINESSLRLTEELSMKSGWKLPILFKNCILPFDHKRMYSIISPSLTL